MDRGVDHEYESETIEYTQTRKYKPDFILANNDKKLVIEVKGLFESEDRRKHLSVQEQHPDIDIRFVFYANHKLYKGAKSRYSDWCDKHKFKYAFSEIPEEWLEELGIENNNKKEDKDV